MRNQKGFTLIEIIAVLVILGILAAVAVPKYMNLQADAKLKAAMGEVAEMKGTLSAAFAKDMLSRSGSGVTAATVLSRTGFTSGTASSIGSGVDTWNVTLTAAASTVTVNVNSYGATADLSYVATGYWVLPSVE